MTDQPETAVSAATAEPPTWEWPVLESNGPELSAGASTGGGQRDGSGSAQENASGEQRDDGSGGAAGRPALPKRVPQSNLAEGLKDDPDDEDEVFASPSRMAGFRRAFRGGSGPEEEEDERS